MSSKWNQKLGDPTCPYMTRWVLDLRLFSVRLHKFHRSDDDRHLHDHPWWFVSLLLRGTYREWTLWHPSWEPSRETDQQVCSPWRRVGSIAFRPALHKHRVEIHPGATCWTLCLTGPIRRVWGFWDKATFFPSGRYFGLFGHPPCKD